MNLARSTFYDEPVGQPPGDAKVVQKIGEICAEYPRYGYRRVTAQLHRDGLAVNHKRAMRIMREQGLIPILKLTDRRLPSRGERRS